MASTRTITAATLIVMAMAACAPTPTAEPQGSVQSSPTASSSASVAASIGADPVAWERVMTIPADDALGTLETAREVIHGSAGFLAITETSFFGEGAPAVTGRRLWLSADGTAWEQVEFPVAVEEGSLQGVITTADDTYVLIFAFPTDGGLGSRTVTLVSADGRSWEEFDSGLPDNLGVSAVERGAQGWLLVGPRFGGEVENPGAWYSSDGITWELVAELAVQGRWIRASDAAAGDDGFVIVGTDAGLGVPGHEWFALASADGREWVESRPLFEPTERADQPDPHVAALGSGWVAALPLPDGSVRFWTSDDGLDWAEAGGVEGSGTQFGFGLFLQAVGDRLFFPFVGGGQLFSDPGAWSSTDALTWEPVDLGADVSLGGIAAGAGTVVLTGTEQTAQGTQAGIWVSRAN